MDTNHLASSKSLFAQSLPWASSPRDAEGPGQWPHAAPSHCCWWRTQRCTWLGVETSSPGPQLMPLPSSCSLHHHLTLLKTPLVPAFIWQTFVSFTSSKSPKVHQQHLKSMLTWDRSQLPNYLGFPVPSSVIDKMRPRPPGHSSPFSLHLVISYKQWPVCLGEVRAFKSTGRFVARIYKYCLWESR